MYTRIYGRRKIFVYIIYIYSLNDAEYFFSPRRVRRSVPVIKFRSKYIRTVSVRDSRAPCRNNPSPAKSPFWVKRVISSILSVFVLQQRATTLGTQSPRVVFTKEQRLCVYVVRTCSVSVPFPSAERTRFTTCFLSRSFSTLLFFFSLFLFIKRSAEPHSRNFV